MRVQGGEVGRRQSSGFTLLELMIVVVIVAILASVAVPSYQESVRRSRHAEAQTAVYGLAQAMERFFTINNTYTGASLSGATPIFPANVPATGGTPTYVLSMTIVAAGNDYTITATRQGAQSTDPCGDFRLTAAGARSLVGASKTLAQCWP